MIEVVSSSLDNVISLVENRQSGLEQISDLLDSLTNIDDLRNRISYLITNFPPDAFNPTEYPDNSGSHYPGYHSGHYSGYSGSYPGGVSPVGSGDHHSSSQVYSSELQLAEQLAEQNAANYPQYTHEQLVQHFLDMQLSTGSYMVPIGRFRRSSDVEVAEILYKITRDVTSVTDLEQLRSNHVSFL